MASIQMITYLVYVSNWPHLCLVPAPYWQARISWYGHLFLPAMKTSSWDQIHFLPMWSAVDDRKHQFKCLLRAVPILLFSFPSFIHSIPVLCIISNVLRYFSGYIYIFCHRILLSSCVASKSLSFSLVILSLCCFQAWSFSPSMFVCYTIILYCLLVSAFSLAMFICQTIILCCFQVLTFSPAMFVILPCILYCSKSLLPCLFAILSFILHCFKSRFPLSPCLFTLAKWGPVDREMRSHNHVCDKQSSCTLKRVND